MPADTLRALVRSGKVESLEELARGFMVSGTAMSYRLQNLGFIR